MRNFLKTVVVCVLLLCAVLLVSCGDTPAPGCTHPEEFLSVKTVEATCTDAGVTTTTCKQCGYTDSVEIPALGHNHEEQYVARVGTDMQVCTRCGDSYFLVFPEDTLRLTGYCTGDVVFGATATDGYSPIELTVDDAPASKINCNAETQSALFANGLEEGQHIFRFINTGRSTVMIREVSMEGKLNRPGSVLLEMPATAKGQYGTFRIYVQTSDPSGDYYIRYNMVLDNNDTRNIYKADSTTNVCNFRIRAAQLVKVVKVTETSVLGSEMFDVMQNGEVSLAFKQTYVDPSALSPEALEMLGSSTTACDFSGGFHGDERIESVELFAGGEKVLLEGRTKTEVIPCSAVTFNQTATIYAWGTSTADSYGIPELLHTQNFIIDSNGIRNHQTAIWLGDNYHIGSFYFQMFTMKRAQGNKLICESFDTYDENGNLLGSQTVPAVVEKQEHYLNNTQTRLVKYRSAESGVSAEAGFRVLNNSVKPNAIYIAARVYGDNKLYCSFESTKNGKNPENGETWEIEVHYNIDFVSPQ